MAIETTADAWQALRRFWQPRYWPIWLGLAWLRLASLLPVKGQLALGRGLGWLMHHALAERRHIAARNLDLCFPEMSATSRADILRQHFASLGMLVMEHGLAWWASDDEVRARVDLRGTEHLKAALATGRGIVLLAGHFASQEFSGRALRLFHPNLGALYRPNKNPFVDQILWIIRAQTTHVMIPKQSMRRMIRTLRQGVPVWYAPDQSHRRPPCALVPFFGEPAMTTTALSEIARMGNALVLPLLPRRFADTGRYSLEILPPLDNFPGASPEDDARKVNAILETHIRSAPEQYFWIHRRFKGRPAPWPDPYAPDPGAGPGPGPGPA